jgi:transcriptional regulator GlxA family with amidase domain
LREEFPRVRISDQLFTIDRDRFTCSGGTAPLDLMLNLIQGKLGPRISQLVSEQFIVERVRKDTDRQYIPLRAQVGVSHRGLIRVAQLMEENIEKPLSLEKIAKSTGLSRRQIERLFKRDLHCVPKHYYLEMRLRRARELLLQTAMPIMDITTACGFQSPPHFSRSATACSSDTRRARSARSANASMLARAARFAKASSPRRRYSEFVSLPNR